MCAILAAALCRRFSSQDDSDGEYDGGGRKKRLADKPVAFVSAGDKKDQRKDKVLYGEYEYVIV